MKTASLILFAAYSIIHLYHSYHDDAEKRARTKPYLLLLLLLYYILAARDLDYYLVMALFFSWLGDLLLIPKGHNWFIYGGISFILSHIFFILTYLHNIDLKTAPLMLVIPAAVLYYGISFVIIHLSGRRHRKRCCR